MSKSKRSIYNADPQFVADDGLYIPEIRRHSAEKIRLHNTYAHLFSSSMGNKWPQRVYLGLFSGAGYARIKGTNDIIETSTLSALRIPTPFTHYIFVDQDPDCISALEKRCEPYSHGKELYFIRGDVNESGSDILARIPPFSKDRGTLTFCFIDPFDLGIKLDLTRELSHLKIDILTLLMTGVDFKRNFRMYFEDLSNTRIDDLLGNPAWRGRCAGTPSLQEVITMYDEAMMELGFMSARDTAKSIKVWQKGVHLYHLALYTKNAMAKRLWQAAMQSNTTQTDFISELS